LDIALVRQKLAQPYVFLEQMRERERNLIGEPLEALLSAFLTSAMAVRDPFLREKAVKDWRENWEQNNLKCDQIRLLTVMREGRHDEAHIGRKFARKSHRARSASRKRAKAGIKFSVGHEEIKIGSGGSYSDKTGQVHGYGSPAVLLSLGINSTSTIHKQTYNFEIDGEQYRVTDVCATYLALLERMVTQYEADKGQPYAKTVTPAG
jgi:hypothetical protein